MIGVGYLRVVDAGIIKEKRYRCKRRPNAIPMHATEDLYSYD
jgi:hypothetical protein